MGKINDMYSISSVRYSGLTKLTDSVMANFAFNAADVRSDQVVAHEVEVLCSEVSKPDIGSILMRQMDKNIKGGFMMDEEAGRQLYDPNNPEVQKAREACLENDHS